MESQRKFIETADGSTTIYDIELDESYHSRHGAINESIHVFIQNGLRYVTSSKNEVRVFEMGFGTGLNALLSILEATTSKLKLTYHTIEAYPLNTSEVKRLNYGRKLKSDLLLSLHEFAWDQEILLKGHHFKKIYGKIEQMHRQDKYDLIYFDAFGPRVQPRLWEQDIIDLMYKLLYPGGVLVTYCAKGEVKRRLTSAGFNVQALPGPPGKREMIRALKTSR